MNDYMLYIKDSEGNISLYNEGNALSILYDIIYLKRYNKDNNLFLFSKVY